MADHGLSFPGTIEADIEKGIVDSKGDDNDKVTPREFFWDRIAVLFGSLLLGLAAINIFTELLRADTGVVCDLTDYDNLSDATVQYILTLCSQHLPLTQYIPVYNVLQGLLILLPHFLWKGVFTSDIEHFLSLSNSLKLMPNLSSGNYPRKNKVIIERLQLNYSVYNRSDVFFWYKVKLVLQIVTSVVGILLVIIPQAVYSFGNAFSCPSDVSLSAWSLPKVVTCIVQSTRLIELILIFDVVLLIVLVPIIVLGICWCFTRHPSQLEHKEVAAFSYVSGISHSYAVSKPKFNKLRHDLWSSPGGRWQVIKKRFFIPRIKTDFDFLVMLLFNFDSGLGGVFVAGLVELELERLFDVDQQSLNSHIIHNSDPALMRGSGGFIEGDDGVTLNLGWEFPESAYAKYKEKLANNERLVIPNLVRGAVIGFGLRAPDNKVAIEVGFGPLYSGLSLAIARTFKQVGYINFDAAFRPVLSPEDLENLEDEGMEEKSDHEEITSIIVETKKFANNVTSYRVQDNIFSQTTTLQNQFTKEIEPLWKYSRELQFPISFLVIGPITRGEHRTTVNLFLESLIRLLEKSAIVLTLRPVNIESTNTENQFFKFIPPINHFQPLQHEVVISTITQQWPLTGSPHSSSTDTTTTTFRIQCSKTDCDMEVIAYKLKEQ